MHAESLEIMERLLTKHMPIGAATVLDVGSQDVNGTYRPLCESAGLSYTGADVEAGANVDRVIDGSWDAEQFDIVISGQTLEHCQNPFELTRRICDHATELVIIIVPWSHELHRYPIDAWRFLPDGMQILIEAAGWSIVETGIQGRDCFTVAVPGTAVNTPKSQPAYRTQSVTRAPFETLATVRHRLEGSRPFAYTRYGDCDLFHIENPKFNGGRYHKPSPGMSRELTEGFMIRDPDYLLGCVISGSVGYRAPDRSVRQIAWQHHGPREYESSVALQTAYMMDTAAFVEFCEVFQQKRVLLIGGESIARCPLVLKAFNVNASIKLPDTDAYAAIDAQMDRIHKQIPHFDCIMLAASQTARVLAKRIWLSRHRTQIFDVGSVVDALAERMTRSWIKKHRDRLLVYRQAFQVAP